MEATLRNIHLHALLCSYPFSNRNYELIPMQSNSSKGILNNFQIQQDNISISIKQAYFLFLNIFPPLPVPLLNTPSPLKKHNNPPKPRQPNILTLTCKSTHIIEVISMQQVSILPLGAACQVGRSCLILTINNKKIMLDCGLMINKEDKDSLPLFESINPEELSLILITHAHLDHCGALPFFLAQYPNFKKKVFMTKPTKDIYHYLVRDTAKVQKDKALFNAQEILDSLQRIYPVQFGVQAQQEGIKFTPYVAGHIVGAAMFIIEVDGVKVLYTGDYSCEEDRYIMKAEIPQSNVDILIAESTFGVRVHESRRMREQKFQEYVHKIVKGGGKCLLPVFSAGRAEELLFILDQYWQQKSEELGHIQIYYTVSLIDKCRNIYETYIDMLSKKIRQRFYKQDANPFKYRHIHYLKKNTRIYSEQNNPMVVMCTPGMLQNGQSRTLLERWCHDPKNGVCITGYCAEGSIASNLKKGDYISSMENPNQKITVNLSVEEISFAAHADCAQTTEFVRRVQPSHVVLVHGSAKNAENLREYIAKQFPQITTVSCPKNEEQLKFQIQISQKYHITGELKKKIEEIVNKDSHNFKEQFEGYIVNTGNQKILVDEKDKNKFFPELKGLEIKEKVHVNYIGGMTLAQLLADKIFGKSYKTIEEGNEVLVIKDCVKMIITEPRKKALVEFSSSQKNVIIADQFCYLLSNIFMDPFDMNKQEELSNLGELEKQRMELVTRIILDDYPDSLICETYIIVRNKGEEMIATLNLAEKKVDCQDEYLRMRLYGILDQYLGGFHQIQAQEMEQQKSLV